MIKREKRLETKKITKTLTLMELRLSIEDIKIEFF